MSALFTFRVPVEMRQQLRELSKQTGRSVSAIIKAGIAEVLERERAKAA
jgi:predicted DNA-binding protein